MNGSLRLTQIVAILVVVAACGGETESVPPTPSPTATEPTGAEDTAEGTAPEETEVATTPAGPVGDLNQLGLGDRGLDRCSLMSEAEAEQWLGAPVTAGPSQSALDEGPDLVTCLYENLEASKVVLIQVYDGEIFFAEEGSGLRAGTETIDGLGEDAWMEQGTVQFLQNNWTVSVNQIIGLIPDEDLLEIAELISSRLP